MAWFGRAVYSNQVVYVFGISTDCKFDMIIVLK